MAVFFPRNGAVKHDTLRVVVEKHARHWTWRAVGTDKDG